MTSGPTRGELRIVPDAGALAAAAADEVARCAAAAVRAHGAFRIALAGGSTPRALYRRLADAGAPWRGGIAWERTEVFFGDERAVPPDHPDSNHRMASEALLSHVAPAAVHRMEGELEPAEAAARYERVLRARVRPAGAPTLDLVLLGLGADGHTASLFPGSAALEEGTRWVAAPFVSRLRAHRITLTIPALAAAAEILFLVTGAKKAHALARLRATPPGEEPIPAARVWRAAARPRLLADAAAGASLEDVAP